MSRWWWRVVVTIVMASSSQGWAATMEVAVEGDVWPAMRDGVFWYVDQRGEFVIAPQFEGARNFSEGRACVQQDGRWGYIDRSGRFVIAAQFDWAYDFSDGLAFAGIGEEIGTIDATGRFVDRDRPMTVEAAARWSGKTLGSPLFRGRRSARSWREPRWAFDPSRAGYGMGLAAKQ